MDTLFIKELCLSALIGIHPHERTQRQPILINIDIAYDSRAAARSDSINHALDYQKITEAITALVQESQFFLVESLAEAIAELLQRVFDIPWLRLSLSKPQALPDAKHVGLQIERGTAIS